MLLLQSICVKPFIIPQLFEIGKACKSWFTNEKTAAQHLTPGRFLLGKIPMWEEPIAIFVLASDHSCQGCEWTTWDCVHAGDRGQGDITRPAPQISIKTGSTQYSGKGGSYVIWKRHPLTACKKTAKDFANCM